jgi:hypothetical protein
MTEFTADRQELLQAVARLRTSELEVELKSLVVTSYASS